MLLACEWMSVDVCVGAQVVPSEANAAVGLRYLRDRVNIGITQTYAVGACTKHTHTHTYTYT